MPTLEFTIERNEDNGVLVASWNDRRAGGITTEADTLAELERAIQEAVRCQLEDGARPSEGRLHFSSDLVVQVA